MHAAVADGTTTLNCFTDYITCYDLVGRSGTDGVGGGDLQQRATWHPVTAVIDLFPHKLHIRYISIHILYGMRLGPRTRYTAALSLNSTGPFSVRVCHEYMLRGNGSRGIPALCMVFPRQWKINYADAEWLEKLNSKRHARTQPSIPTKSQHSRRGGHQMSLHVTAPPDDSCCGDWTDSACDTHQASFGERVTTGTV